MVSCLGPAENNNPNVGLIYELLAMHSSS